MAVSLKQKQKQPKLFFLVIAIISLKISLHNILNILIESFDGRFNKVINKGGGPCQGRWFWLWQEKLYVEEGEDFVITLSFFQWPKPCVEDDSRQAATVVQAVCRFSQPEKQSNLKLSHCGTSVHKDQMKFQFRLGRASRNSWDFSYSRKAVEAWGAERLLSEAVSLPGSP